MKLEHLRNEIDALDEEILHLFLRRMEVVEVIAELKHKAGAPIEASGREHAILAGVAERTDEELLPYANALFRTLFNVSRAYQERFLHPHEGPLASRVRGALEASAEKVFPKKGVIAVQGMQGNFSQVACERLFSQAEMLYCIEYETVLQALEKGICQYAVLPIEHSVHGFFSEVFTLLRRYPAYITKTVEVKTQYTLMANPGTELTQVLEIFGHTRALGQYAAFTKANPGIRVTVCESNIDAALMAAQCGRADVAAIAPPAYAARFGMVKIAHDAPADAVTTTRYACLSKELAIYPGANRVAMMITVSNKTGSLHALVERFSGIGVNITKLEGRKDQTGKDKIIVLIELEGSLKMPELLKVLDELADGPEGFTFLGSYADLC